MPVTTAVSTGKSATPRTNALLEAQPHSVEAERTVKGKDGRSAGIAAARDRFYKGDIAREMMAFLSKHDTPYEFSDFAEYFAKVEPPARNPTMSAPMTPAPL